MKTLALAVLVLAAALPAFATDMRPNMLRRMPVPHEHPLYLDALSSDLLSTARNISNLVRYLHPETFAERNGKFTPLAAEDHAWARATLEAELAAARGLVHDGGIELEKGIPQNANVRPSGKTFIARPVNSFKANTPDGTRDAVALMQGNAAGAMGVLIDRKRQPPVADPKAAKRAADDMTLYQNNLNEARAALKQSERVVAEGR